MLISRLGLFRLLRRSRRGIMCPGQEGANLQPIVVIGYGNTLRGDDGFGQLAARLLEARQIQGLEVIASHQLNPELAAWLAEARFAVFLDATEGNEPGGSPGNFSRAARYRALWRDPPLRAGDASGTGQGCLWESSSRRPDHRQRAQLRAWRRDQRRGARNRQQNSGGNRHPGGFRSIGL